MPDLEQVIESWAGYQGAFETTDIEAYECVAGYSNGDVGWYAFFKDRHFMVYRGTASPLWVGRGSIALLELKRLLEESGDWAKITPSFETKTAVMVAYLKGDWDY